VIAVASNEPGVDSVGLCVGERGGRTKALVSELGGEKIDVVLWEESTERFISNLMCPLCVIEASFDEASREANVQVVRRHEKHKPDLALRSKLLMDLTGWKLHVEVKDES
jgi:N utilization substance protein A